MTFVDMFAGMGNVRLGLEQAGHTCVWSIEFDPHKRRIYEIIYGRAPEGSDIREVSAGNIPSADCWCFGFPCQDISVAGKQLGFDGERSSLFFAVMRLLSQTAEVDRPGYLFIENVKNLLSIHHGWVFARALFALDALGYDAEWALLNSKNFGVPQNRERIYIIGHLRGRRTSQVFPLRYGDGLSPQGGGAAREEGQCAAAVTKDYAKAPNARGENYVRQVGNVMPTSTRDNPNQGRVYDPAGIAPCLNKMEGGGREPMIVQACITPDRLRKGQNGRRFKAPGEPSFTLTKAGPQGVAISYDLKATPGSTRRGAVKTGYVGALDTQCNVGVTFGTHTHIRKLTPRECMRLQGVPDSITDKLIAAGISDTQLYRAAGDAVTVNVVREIGKRMG